MQLSALRGWEQADAETLNAFLAQQVAAWMREGDLPPNPSAEDWRDYEAACEESGCGGKLQHDTTRGEHRHRALL